MVNLTEERKRIALLLQQSNLTAPRSEASAQEQQSMRVQLEKIDARIKAERNL